MWVLGVDRATHKSVPGAPRLTFHTHNVASVSPLSTSWRTIRFRRRGRSDKAHALPYHNISQGRHLSPRFDRSLLKIKCGIGFPLSVDTFFEVAIPFRVFVEEDELRDTQAHRCSSWKLDHKD